MSTCETWMQLNSLSLIHTPCHIDLTKDGIRTLAIKKSCFYCRLVNLLLYNQTVISKKSKRQALWRVSLTCPKVIYSSLMAALIQKRILRLQSLCCLKQVVFSRDIPCIYHHFSFLAKWLDWSLGFAMYDDWIHRYEAVKISGLKSGFFHPRQVTKAVSLSASFWDFNPCFYQDSFRLL